VTKTWFITGALKGFGREWAEAALGRAIEVATREYEWRLATWNEWQPVSVEAYGAKLAALSGSRADQRANANSDSPASPSVKIVA
jgi:hypothetical protein